MRPAGPNTMTTGVANWLSGACLAFSATAFDRLGGFGEDFFLYWEDVDISAAPWSWGCT